MLFLYWNYYSRAFNWTCPRKMTCIRVRSISLSLSFTWKTERHEEIKRIRDEKKIAHIQMPSQRTYTQSTETERTMNVGHFQQISLAPYVYTYVLSRNPINLYSASLHIPKLTSKLQQQEQLQYPWGSEERAQRKEHQITMCLALFKYAFAHLQCLSISIFLSLSLSLPLYLCTCHELWVCVLKWFA